MRTRSLAANANTVRASRKRWAAAKLRGLLSANATHSDTLYKTLPRQTVSAIVTAIRELEGRAS